MTTALNETHDPAATSWVASANAAEADFPLQNLPFGRFRRSAEAPWRIGVAIGDEVLDLALAAAAITWPEDTQAALDGMAAGDLNGFMGRPSAVHAAVRRALSAALRSDSAHAQALRPCLVPQSAVELGVPCRIGDYTDFYTGIHHATAIGRLFRPDAPLMPNYKWVPIGYHGRASSIIASGQPFRRPRGQTKAPDAAAPSLGPCRRLDYELELGIYVGTPNALGEPIAVDNAEAHVFGIGLLNDWSARDIQAWEYQPLGPFLAKNFASTVSPWIVTLEALAPFRVPFTRPEGDPEPLPYLDSSANRRHGAIDARLQVLLQTPAMRQASLPPQTLTESNFTDAYWTLAQLVAHHTVNGCNLQAGDLLGTGTLSGRQPAEAGSLMELSDGGKRPFVLANGERRTFLEDGDCVVLRAFCERPGARRIGLGECAGTVLPA